MTGLLGFSLCFGCVGAGSISIPPGQDAAVAAPDSGTRAVDAAEVSADAALQAPDAGRPELDAGAATPDASEIADASAPPDASASPDASTPDASTAADASGPPDASSRPDASGTPDAGPGSPDAASSLPDAGAVTFTPPPDICPRPVALVDTSSPRTIVGNGTPASCTEQALRTAINAAGVITFDCGPAPAVIPIRSTLELRIDADTVIDGGGRVTLDGGGAVRILRFHSPNFRAVRTAVTLQRLRLQGGRAPAGTFYPKPPEPSRCAWGYKDGEGGALSLRDGVLRVIECEFLDNHAASPGPDVGGGAIYAVGSLEVTVVNSRFAGNSGSNSGAVGFLQTTGQFVNTIFEGNAATGEGQNFVEPGCPMFNHDEQGGAGGNAGAVGADGVEPTELRFCGVTFRGNQANELAGAVGRTPNGARQRTSFDRCTIAENWAGAGGGGLYISNSDFVLHDSTVSGNTTPGLGAGVRTELGSVADIVNVTFQGNRSTGGLGGGLSHGGTGLIRNCTFAENRADGGPGLFSAAVVFGNNTTIENTIFWNNVTADIWNPMTCYFNPSPGANDLQWPRLRAGSQNQDTACVNGVTWADAQLGALQDNGGPTRTMMPIAGSPAIGFGRNCPAADQRGRPRNAASCTAGAVEAP